MFFDRQAERERSMNTILAVSNLSFGEFLLVAVVPLAIAAVGGTIAAFKGWFEWEENNR